MMLQILIDDRLGDRTGAPDSIANPPEVPASVALLQRGILLQELAGTASFDPTHDLTDRMFRRIRQVQMHVIAADDALDNPNIEGITDLPNQVATAHLDLAPEYAVSILGAEDQMHL